ncbi:MAG: TolC family protein [Phycisphaerales bacterium]|jgi:outer membrane protein TolC
MRNNEIKEQKSMWLVRHQTVLVSIILIIIAGCSTSHIEEEANNKAMIMGLDKIDTVQLSEHSVSSPVTVEQATEEITQQVTDSNESQQTITLSLEQVREAALANNLDLKVELVDPSIVQTALDEERAKFEAAFFGSAETQRSKTATAVTKTQDYELSIEKPLPTGGLIEVGLPFGDDMSSGGVADAAASVSVIQSLLRGAGTRINTQSIRIAGHERNIINARTKLVAIYLLASADIAYWRLYAARKELDVRREQYKLAQDQLNHAKKKVAAGSAAKIEIVRAEAGLSGRLEAVINAETTVLNRTRDIQRIMNRDDMPLEAVVDIVTQTEPNPLGLGLDERQLTEQALSNRMEMVELELQLTIDELNVELARNNTLPDLALNYTYAAQAQESTIGGALGDLTDNPFDSHSVGLSVAVPLGNRVAKARLQRAQLLKMQDQVRRNRLQQLIRQEVYNAVSELRGNWRRILAAEQGVTAAYRDYKVEQSQFQLGVRTSTDVLYSATRLADAQLGRIRAFTDYEIAQIYLAQATGTLLGKGQIQIASVDIDDSLP